MRVVVDRIDGSMAVLEISMPGVAGVNCANVAPFVRMIDWPARALPTGAKEGSVLTLTLADPKAAEK